MFWKLERGGCKILANRAPQRSEPDFCVCPTALISWCSAPSFTLTVLPKLVFKRLGDSGWLERHTGKYLFPHQRLDSRDLESFKVLQFIVFTHSDHQVLGFNIDDSHILEMVNSLLSPILFLYTCLCLNEVFDMYCTSNYLGVSQTTPFCGQLRLGRHQIKDHLPRDFP